MRGWLRWLVLHGVVRVLSLIGIRGGDPPARLIADPAVRADPIPLIDELRSEGRLVRGRGVYLTVDHQIAHDLLRSDDFRVAPLGAELPQPLRWVQEKASTGLWHPLEPPSLLAIEPPEHTCYRTLMRSAFTTHAIAALRDSVEETTKALLENLRDRPGTVDVVEHYCLPLPVIVIGHVLGVPDEDLPQFLSFGKPGAPSLDYGQSWRQYREARRAIVGFNTWLANRVEQLRRTPRDDLLSHLIQDARLDDRELQATAGLVLFAGFETTVNLLGNGIKLLLEHPKDLVMLASRPELWPNAVQEILRLDSPVQITFRVARRDVNVAGTAVRRGEIVVIYLAGANRDPAVFDDPHRFDIERPNANKHLSFSSGRHFCLGAALARAEGEVGLRSFFDRYPNTRLAGACIRGDTRVLGGWSSLPVALSA